MGRRWKALRHMRRHERLLLLEATTSLFAVWISVQVSGYAKTRSMLARRSRTWFVGTVRSGGDKSIEETIAEVARAVAISSHYAPFSATCLHRTLTLWWMLRRRGIDSVVRIGAAQTEQGMAAHAWLERGGFVLNDDADIGRRFSPFMDVGWPHGDH